MNLSELIKKEGWTVIRENGQRFIKAEANIFPLTHPALIHLKLFRTAINPDIKYSHMKAAHDYLWPNTVWHYWTERRFRAHCRGYSTITYASGSSTSKSYDAAKIAILFWLANPSKRTVIIASTSLESLSSRIWGYVTKFIKQMAVNIPYHYLGGQTPKILYKSPKSGDNNQDRIKDTIHGMFAVAARQGDDERVISPWIGRHPDEALILILDESTDMPPALLTVIPNLESGVEFFQLMAIGNSLSRFDLHGALSTPKNGWNSVDPLKDTEWETTQKNGICLYFSCYESPAIFESDPQRKAKLSKFLPTEEGIKSKIQTYGMNSDLFWRFVLGFWKKESTDDVIISRQFLDQFHATEAAEYSGTQPIHIVAGLDVAFSTGGDKAVLRLAVLGTQCNGQMVLDYRKESLLFVIPITANTSYPADLQVADYVLRVLNQYNVNVRDMAVDCTGQGRAIASVIQLRGQTLFRPIQIYSTQTGRKTVNSFDLVIRSPYEMWFALREFIQNSQIRGLDHETYMQLVNRRFMQRGKKLVLEPKLEYKNRMRAITPNMAHSPDEADATALCLQAAIINYNFYPGQKLEVKKLRSSFEDQKYKAFLELQNTQRERDRVVTESPPTADFKGKLTDMLGASFNRMLY